MKIVIDASPERLSSVTFYDGIGNQMYPPHYIQNENLINYIHGVADEGDIHEIILCGPEIYTTKIGENLRKHFTTVHFTLLK